MNFVGRDLKKDGFDIWHSGNFTPPTSLPAEGGNSDTVDGLHANDFVKVQGDVKQITNYNGAVTYENVGHYYSGSAGPVGTLCINLGNIGNVMIDAEISLQSYTGVTKYHVRGYTYTGSANWHMPNVTCIGSGLNHGVRFAKNASGQRLILIGLTNTSWGGYLHAVIPRLTIGYGATNSAPDWAITLVTSETGFVIGSTPAMNSGLDADLLDGKHASDFAASNHNHDTNYEPKDTNIQSHISNRLNPHAVTKAQIGLGSVLDYGLATQAEAEAGTSAVKYMTPQRTKQAIDKFKPTKLSELTNDIGAGGGIKITTSTTAPTGTSPGDFWYKEV